MTRPFRLPRRIFRRVEAEFQQPGSAPVIVAELEALVNDLASDLSDSGWHAWGERLCAAVVLRAGGDHRRFTAELAVARTDWRDVLVGAGLGGESWPARLDVLFGPARD